MARWTSGGRSSPPLPDDLTEIVVGKQKVFTKEGARDSAAPAVPDGAPELSYAAPW
jgi:hypothetical protein